MIMDPRPVEENVCDIKMNALADRISLMFQPVTAGIDEIKRDVAELKRSASGYVSWEVFRDKCKEIEDMKKFVWKVSGGLSVVSFLIGLAVKFLK